MIKIVCISDTHGMEDLVKVPEGDLLIHAGDMTNIGERWQLESFNKWIKELNFKKKIVIPGNHDRTIDKYSQYSNVLSDCDLLIDSYTRFENLKIYGSPWTPWFGGDYWVYNARRGKEIREHWDKIPDDTDILVTHGPPYSILDNVPNHGSQGCEELLKIVKKIKPKLHIFGHLHDNHGKMYSNEFNTTFVNAAICNEAYQPINPPIVIEI